MMGNLLSKDYYEDHYLKILVDVLNFKKHAKLMMNIPANVVLITLTFGFLSFFHLFFICF